MKIYLAGPMAGYPDLNYPLFHAVSKELRARGHEVFSPAENDERKGYGKVVTGQTTPALRHALGDDLAWICKEAEAVALLPGWENSRGARAEWSTAVALGLKLIYVGVAPPEEKP